MRERGWERERGGGKIARERGREGEKRERDRQTDRQREHVFACVKRQKEICLRSTISDSVHAQERGGERERGERKRERERELLKM